MSEMQINLSLFHVRDGRHLPHPYPNPFLDTPEVVYETIRTRPLWGTKDAAANYTDGGVINTADLKLTSPIDVLLALLRDKDVGMGKKVADIDVSVPAIRTALGTRRVDGQLTEPMTSEHLSRFARQHDMAINVVGKNLRSPTGQPIILSPCLLADTTSCA